MKVNLLTKTDNKNIVLNIIKSACWGVSFSLICILIFAFVIKFTNISENSIQPINQIIKGLSILFACFILSKHIKTQGWLNGLLTGLIYTILSFFIFSILDGNFAFNLSFLNDLVFGTIMGLISGIICINIRK